MRRNDPAVHAYTSLRRREHRGGIEGASRGHRGDSMRKGGTGEDKKERRARAVSLESERATKRANRSVNISRENRPARKKQTPRAQARVARVYRVVHASLRQPVVYLRLSATV